MVIPVGKLPPVKTWEVFTLEKGIKKTEFKSPIISPKEEILRQYTLVWSNPDAFEEGYSWITDFMEKPFLGFKVIKPKETYRFGFRTPEWQQTKQKIEGEMNMATGLLSQITNLMRFLTGMYSQRQKVVEMLRLYKEGKEPDELALKGLWADYVDAKKAGASIIAYEKNYEYVVIRDLFFACKTPEEVDEAPANEKVKIVVKRKLAEYLKWREEWNFSLEKSFGIIEESIKRYENQIELYKEWLKPVLRDIYFLEMKTQFPKWHMDPYIMEMNPAGEGFIQVVGWLGGLDVKDISKSMENLNKKEAQIKEEAKKKIPILSELATQKEELSEQDYEEEARELILKNNYGLWVPIMELKFGAGFSAAGVPVKWSAYKMVADVKIITLDLFLKKWKEEWTVDPSEKWINQMLDPLNKAKEKAKEKKEEGYFTQISSYINSIFEGINIFIVKLQRFFSYSSHEIYLKKEKGKEDLWNKSFTVYEKFKKAHSMLTWGKYSFKSVGSGVIKIA